MTRKYTKAEAIGIVVRCAQTYKQELDGKNLLFICTDKHKKTIPIELSFYGNNYLHLTGLKAPKSENGDIAVELFANDFYNAWKFAPFLMISVVFGGMCGLLGGMFAAVKQSRINAMSSFSGACINIMLNIPLTFFFNALGASFATLMSYFTVWLIRLYNPINCLNLLLK